MTEGFAIGAAVHYDFVLAEDPAPFAAIVRRLFGERSPDGRYTHFFIWDDKRKAPPSVPLDLDKLLRLVTEGKLSRAAVETRPKTPDAEQMLVSVGTVPRDRRSRSLTKCRYRMDANFGAARLREIGAQRALDAVIEFADAVAARAGVVHWAETTIYASCLASGHGSFELTKAQSSHASDLLYWQPRWGDVIQGPQWGTFLGAAHVEALRGLARIERESGCARVIGLRSGGAFLQATPLDEPIVEDHDDHGVLARLAAFLAPVMGHA